MSKSMAMLIFVVLVVLTSAIDKPESSYPLPKCKQYEDTDGSWLYVKDINTSTLALKNFETKHFYHGGGGYAMKFDRVWVPKTCAYHRFTNETITKCLVHHHTNHEDKLRNTKSTKKPYKIAFYGESGLRGVVCGILRLILGNEMTGPCSPGICSRSMSHTGMPYTEHVIPGLLDITFVYSKSWFILHEIDKDFVSMETNIRNELTSDLDKGRPDVIVMASGIWDFYEIALGLGYGDYDKRDFLSSPYCTLDSQREVSKRRANDYVNSTFIHEFGQLAYDNNVRLIYKNNHHNAVYPSICADQEFEKLVTDSASGHSQGLERTGNSAGNINSRSWGWEIWDNRNISIDSFKLQIKDGYHFERHHVFTTEDHINHMNEYKKEGREIPGALEMQLAQSLLNNIFQDCLHHHKFHDHKKR